MKRYYASVVDLSEISPLTATGAQRDYMRTRLRELGFVNEDGPAPKAIEALCRKHTRRFFTRLEERMQSHPGGFEAVFCLMERFFQNGEYRAMYLYQTLLYGYLGWEMPRSVGLLTLEPGALEIYMEYLVSAFEKYFSYEEERKETPHELD